jgi:hypothetical protein
VLDTVPPSVYNAISATSEETLYDHLGRYYYLRLSQAF